VTVRKIGMTGYSSSLAASCVSETPDSTLRFGVSHVRAMSASLVRKGTCPTLVGH
jgi:hypothetical protein